MEHITERETTAIGGLRTGQDEQVSAISTRTSSAKGNRWLILLSLASLYLIWGMTYLGMRIGMDGFPPFLLIGIRFLVAGSILYAVLRVRGAPVPKRSEWIGAGIIGILLLVGGNGGVIYSEQWVATGVAAVGIAAVPLWTALFSGLWGLWPTRKEWLGLSIGFVGVILLNLGHGLWGNPQGAIALLIAPLCWALGAAWSRHISLPSGLMSSAVEMLVAGPDPDRSEPRAAGTRAEPQRHRIAAGARLSDRLWFAGGVQRLRLLDTHRAPGAGDELRLRQPPGSYRAGRAAGRRATDAGGGPGGDDHPVRRRAGLFGTQARITPIDADIRGQGSREGLPP